MDKPAYYAVCTIRNQYTISILCTMRNQYIYPPLTNYVVCRER